MRQAGSANTRSNSSPPTASIHAAKRPVSQRVRMSTRRLTPPASPAGMQAATATANSIAITSLSAMIAVLASQRSMTSTTVTPAAISMPSTPTKAIGRLMVTQCCSARARIESPSSGRDTASAMRLSAVRRLAHHSQDVPLLGRARGRHLGAEGRQCLLAVRHALAPLDRDVLEPLLPLGFLLGRQRGDAVLDLVAAALPCGLRDLAELAAHQQIRMLVDRRLCLRRQRVVALAVDDDRGRVATERGIEVIFGDLLNLEGLHPDEWHQHAVGRTPLQRGVGLVGAEADRRRAERGHDLGGDRVGGDQLLAAEIVERADRIA